MIISDQTEIQLDDTFCDPASADAVTELQDEILEEAEECGNWLQRIPMLPLTGRCAKPKFSAMLDALWYAV